MRETDHQSEGTIPKKFVASLDRIAEIHTVIIVDRTCTKIEANCRHEFQDRISAFNAGQNLYNPYLARILRKLLCTVRTCGLTMSIFWHVLQCRFIIVTYISDISRVVPLGDISPLKNRDIFDILNISRYIQYVTINREYVGILWKISPCYKNLHGIGKINSWVKFLAVLLKLNILNS